jgi:hypothetical protein
MNAFLLVGLSWVDVLLGVLYVSLAVLVIGISYKKLLNYLGKGRVVKEDYLTLYSVDFDRDKQEYTFYFTANSPKEYRLMILDEELMEIQLLAEGTCSKEGNIVRLMRSELNANSAYYCLETDKQRTMKRFGY